MFSLFWIWLRLAISSVWWRYPLEVVISDSTFNAYNRFDVFVASRKYVIFSKIKNALCSSDTRNVHFLTRYARFICVSHVSDVQKNGFIYCLLVDRVHDINLASISRGTNLQNFNIVILIPWPMVWCVFGLQLMNFIFRQFGVDDCFNFCDNFVPSDVIIIAFM